MSVTPVMMKAELEKAKEITYEVADLDQEGEETKDFAERIMSNGRMLAMPRSPCLIQGTSSAHQLHSALPVHYALRTLYLVH